MITDLYLAKFLYFSAKLFFPCLHNFNHVGVNIISLVFILNINVLRIMY